MTKDINRLEQVLSTVTSQSNYALLEGNNQVFDDMEEAVKYIREGIVRVNKDELFRHFRIFDTLCWNIDQFIENHTFVCHHLGIAVRNFNGWYYAVKIMNLDSCFGGVLTTDAPDNYPMHRFPEDIISSQYPEIVMLKIIDDYNKKQETEEI